MRPRLNDPTRVTVPVEVAGSDWSHFRNVSFTFHVHSLLQWPLLKTNYHNVEDTEKEMLFVIIELLYIVSIIFIKTTRRRLLKVIFDVL